MKIQINNNKLKSLIFGRRSHGYASMAMVASLGMIALLSLTFVFRQGMRSHESQLRNQVSIDYRQKEDALLRALIAVAPNKAIGAMMPDSQNNSADFSWDTVFSEAIAASNAGGALNAAVISSFGISDVIRANTGDMVLSSTSQIITVVDGDGDLVGPGNISNTGLLSNGVVGPKLPPALAYSGSYTRDQSHPIISLNKEYPASAVGLGASIIDYPKYNIIDYPDIRFGLTNQTGTFVAKRNWWAFSLTFGANGSGSDLMPVVKKNYVLSIYEVPSQMALSAGAKMKVGAYADGTAWQNTTITGGVFGTDIDAENLDLLGSSARFSARRSINMSGGSSVGGQSVANGFNELGTRETRWVNNGSEFYGASLAGDSGRVAVLPLSQGEQFIRRSGAVAQTNSVSDTGWFEYAMGALQCKMQIEIREAESGARPVWVRFHYTQGGGSAYRDYKVSDGTCVNHDHDVPGGSVIPFYWENLQATASPALGINLGKIPEFLASLGLSASDRLANNSLSVWANAGQPTVSLPAIPSSNLDMGVVFRQSDDMTEFAKGFSVVTDHRVYFAENFNQVPYPSAPMDAGLPSGEPYYPPVSVFASDKRFGTNLGTVDRVNISGQLTSLQEDDGTIVNPLDLKTDVEITAGESIAAAKMSADLSQIVSPAQLPPVTKMTWLVTVEEIHGTSSYYDDGNNGGGNDPGGVDPSNPGYYDDGNNGGGNDPGGVDPSNPGNP